MYEFRDHIDKTTSLFAQTNRQLASKQRIQSGPSALPFRYLCPLGITIAFLATHMFVIPAIILHRSVKHAQDTVRTLAESSEGQNVLTAEAVKYSNYSRKQERQMIIIAYAITAVLSIATPIAICVVVSRFALNFTKSDTATFTISLFIAASLACILKIVTAKCIPVPNPLNNYSSADIAYTKEMVPNCTMQLNKGTQKLQLLIHTTDNSTRTSEHIQETLNAILTAKHNNDEISKLVRQAIYNVNGASLSEKKEIIKYHCDDQGRYTVYTMQNTGNSIDSLSIYGYANHYDMLSEWKEITITGNILTLKERTQAHSRADLCIKLNISQQNSIDNSTASTVVDCTQFISRSKTKCNTYKEDIAIFILTNIIVIFAGLFLAISSFLIIIIDKASFLFRDSKTTVSVTTKLMECTHDYFKEDPLVETTTLSPSVKGLSAKNETLEQPPADVLGTTKSYTAPTEELSPSLPNQNVTDSTVNLVERGRANSIQHTSNQQCTT